MDMKDLAYLKEKIAALETKTGKVGLASVILKQAESIRRKKPATSAEIAVQRAYDLVSAQLDLCKGFAHYTRAIPIAIKIGDWNRYRIGDINDAWESGEILKRDKLIAEGKVFSKDGKPIAEITKYHKGDEGQFVIDECKLLDDNDKTAKPVPRDCEEKMGKAPAIGQEDKRAKNTHYGWPLDPRYHLELVAIAFDDQAKKVVPELIQLRFNDQAANADSQEFVGATLWNRMMKAFELRAKLVKEDDAIPLHDGDKSVWGAEIADPEIDTKIFEATSQLTNLRPLLLNELEREYTRFFKKDDKKLYDRYAISEVTIKKIEESKSEYYGQSIYIRDSSLSDDDQDVRASLPSWISVTPPKVPCQAIIVYYIKEEEGKWDKKLRKRDESKKTYAPQVVGMGFIEGSELDDEAKKELEEALSDS
jgi:hypothetical protein